MKPSRRSFRNAKSGSSCPLVFLLERGDGGNSGWEPERLGLAPGAAPSFVVASSGSIRGAVSLPQVNPAGMRSAVTFPRGDLRRTALPDEAGIEDALLLL